MKSENPEVTEMAQKDFGDLVVMAMNCLKYLNNGLEVGVVQDDDVNLNVVKSLTKKLRATKAKSKRRKLFTTLNRLMGKARVRRIAPNIKPLREMTATDVLVQGHWWPKEDTKLHKRRSRYVQPYYRNKTDEEMSQEPRIYTFAGGRG